MGVWATLVVMLKTQIGLGVLSVPFLFQVIGMVPGVIAFTVTAVCITCTYTTLAEEPLHGRTDGSCRGQRCKG